PPGGAGARVVGPRGFLRPLGPIRPATADGLESADITDNPAGGYVRTPLNARDGRGTCVKRLVGLALVGSLALAGAPAAVAKSSHPAVIRVKVKITDFKFTPTPLAIKKGTVVVWVNNGPSTHTTTSDTGKWDSGPLTVGTKFRKRF